MEVRNNDCEMKVVIDISFAAKCHSSLIKALIHKSLVIFFRYCNETAKKILKKQFLGVKRFNNNKFQDCRHGFESGGARNHRKTWLGDEENFRK